MTNIFLHNHNYHRLHAPISGKIVRVHRIPGKLTLLRPWLYKKSSPSEPSFKNERVNIDILDLFGRKWFLSLVGGMGVGSIVLNSCVQPGNQIQNGEELAVFLLGSTCCVSIPSKVLIQRIMEKTSPFQKIPMNNFNEESAK